MSANSALGFGRIFALAIAASIFGLVLFVTRAYGDEIKNGETLQAQSRSSRTPAGPATSCPTQSSGGA